MLTTEVLNEKKAKYEAEKSSLQAKDFTTYIAEKVQAFRAEKEAEIAEYEQRVKEEYEAERKNDIEKCEHYIKLLNELLEEETANAEQEPATIPSNNLI
uniref:Uncharacterized protein n=1 Tax=Siphoviridae sp. ctnMR5 TaxID=2825658 RepID=A0A8S5U8W9_9CAUD|nr:MAG TPA: hypothetical protein [Siphoviridae sp. ctnMR5]